MVVGLSFLAKRLRLKGYLPWLSGWFNRSRESPCEAFAHSRPGKCVSSKGLLVEGYPMQEGFSRGKEGQCDVKMAKRIASEDLSL